MKDPAAGLPWRLALAGGWIDQPFVSRLDPRPPGSMVVVSLTPDHAFPPRSGFATSTRAAAAALWGGALPPGEPASLVCELYRAENRGREAPSGSQDMAGLVYPGISRLDYDARVEGGLFPARIESTTDPDVIAWLESVLRLVPVGPRPDGYSPLGVRNLEPGWVRRLGRSGRDAYDAILRRDLAALGASFNECMRCWATLLPETIAHPAIAADLAGILTSYQARYPGAMFSGCGGGYLIIAAGRPVPDSVGIAVRV